MSSNDGPPPETPKTPETPETAGQKAERLMAEATAAAAVATATRSAEALARGAMDAVGKAANGALDAVERMLFGKLGGAEEAAKREAITDPIERLRVEHGLEARTPSPGAPLQTRQEKKQAAMDEAQKQLDVLKRAQAGRSQSAPTGEPVVRTDPKPTAGAAPASPAQASEPTHPPERKRTL